MRTGTADRLRTFALAALLSSGACAPPPTALPAGVPGEARVRVVAPHLGRGWLPGQLVRSSAGCWTVRLAASRREDAIEVVGLSDVVRLQLSRAATPPDWWTEPEEEEGWTELPVADLREDQREGCEAIEGS